MRKYLRLKRAPRWSEVIKLLATVSTVYLVLIVIWFGGSYFYGHSNQISWELYLVNQSEVTFAVTRFDATPPNIADKGQACVVSETSSSRCKIFDQERIKPESKLGITIWRYIDRRAAKRQRRPSFVPLRTVYVKGDEILNAPNRRLSLVIESDGKRIKIIQGVPAGAG